MVTEKGLLTTSRLLVQKAIQADSGLYTCTPSTANAATVRVHILSGKWIGQSSRRMTRRGEKHARLGTTANSFHLVARRTSGGDASRTLDETEQSGSAYNLILLAGHSHLPELSVEVSTRRGRCSERPHIARRPRCQATIKSNCSSPAAAAATCYERKHPQQALYIIYTAIH